MVKVDAVGKITNGKIVKLAGSLDTIGTKASYNGDITMQNLHRQELMSSRISNGYIQAYHTLKVSSNSIGGYSTAVNSVCADCTLPEVIVSSSISAGGGISWGAWMSLLDMFGGGGGYSNDYMFIGGGGGGGGSYSGNVITVDFEKWDSKDAVDVKKYINCFGSVPDAGASYSISISSDIPVDSDPTALFDWSQQTPGHSYITLNKTSGASTISQNIGFYPSSGLKATTGNATDSKIADDAGHEFNARYTINISGTQFQSALSAVNLYSSFQYIISSFNCTDFALHVFNDAGGNLSVPKYQIPNYSNGTTGSNTPQGLYSAINTLSASNTAATAGASKNYAGDSHGPCN